MEMFANFSQLIGTKLVMYKQTRKCDERKCDFLQHKNKEQRR